METIKILIVDRIGEYELPTPEKYNISKQYPRIGELRRALKDPSILKYGPLVEGIDKDFKESPYMGLYIISIPKNKIIPYLKDCFIGLILKSDSASSSDEVGDYYPSIVNMVLQICYCTQNMSMFKDYVKDLRGIKFPNGYKGKDMIKDHGWNKIEATNKSFA